MPIPAMPPQLSGKGPSPALSGLAGAIPPGQEELMGPNPAREGQPDPMMILEGLKMAFEGLGSLALMAGGAEPPIPEGVPPPAPPQGPQGPPLGPQ